jgi:peptide/nickel transport system substrate-binding protein
MAVYLALDMNELNADVAQGAAQVATTLFPQGAEFYNPQIPFPKADPARVQRLFDLAAEGHPVSFSVATTGVDTLAVDIQTKLRSYKNVKVTLDNNQRLYLRPHSLQGNFDLAPYAFGGTDPEPSLASLASDAPLPIASMHDPLIGADLAQGASAADHATRQAAYDNLAVELNKLYRIKWMFTQNTSATVMTRQVTGLEEYGQGSFILQDFGRTQ